MARLFLLLSLVQYANSYSTGNLFKPSTRKFSSIGGECWEEVEQYKSGAYTPPITFNHLGDYSPQHLEDFDAPKRAAFNLNVGKALETLRRELPMVFAVSDLDFSIFASHIKVSDGNNNRIIIQKNLYAGVVKSLKLASSFSFVYPSMNVKKIEYIEDCTTIQCHVDVVLPDSVRIDGQATWEGMFYFGLNSNGLIETHTFDRKISKMKPNSLLNPQLYPWIRAASPKWNEELVGVPSWFQDIKSDIATNMNGKKETLLDLLSL